MTTTLIDVLLDAADRAPDQVIVHVRGDGSERVVTHRHLRDEALRVGAGLRAAAGPAVGNPVILRAERSDDFQPLFWGAIAAGLVPVPLAGDAGRIRAVWRALGRPPVVVGTDRDAAAAPEPDAALRLPALRAAHEALVPHRPAPGDPAFLQYSSGSTGDPRGVELSHANLLANLAQTCAAGGATPDDVLVSWLPYHHDMGLIGTHLAPLSVRMKQVKLGPVAFAKRPALWLEVAARHRATVLSAANFALALVVRRVPDREMAALDLRTVRFFAVGAEPIAPAVWRAFLAKTAPAGLDPGALQPVYGLAEATLTVTAPPLGERAEPLTLDRAALSAGSAVAAPPGAAAAEFMDLGHPVPGCTVRIVDAARLPLPDGRIGHVEVRGPNVARGYHRDPAATRGVLCGRLAAHRRPRLPAPRPALRHRTGQGRRVRQRGDVPRHRSGGGRRRRGGPAARAVRGGRLARSRHGIRPDRGAGAVDRAARRRSGGGRGARRRDGRAPRRPGDRGRTGRVPPHDQRETAAGPAARTLRGT